MRRGFSSVIRSIQALGPLVAAFFTSCPVSAQLTVKHGELPFVFAGEQFDINQRIVQRVMHVDTTTHPQEESMLTQVYGVLAFLQPDDPSSFGLQYPVVNGREVIRVFTYPYWLGESASTGLASVSGVRPIWREPKQPEKLPAGKEGANSFDRVDVLDLFGMASGSDYGKLISACPRLNTLILPFIGCDLASLTLPESINKLVIYNASISEPQLRVLLSKSSLRVLCFWNCVLESSGGSPHKTVQEALPCRVNTLMLLKCGRSFSYAVCEAASFPNLKNISITSEGHDRQSWLRLLRVLCKFGKPDSVTIYRTRTVPLPMNTKPLPVRELDASALYELVNSKLKQQKVVLVEPSVRP